MNEPSSHWQLGTPRSPPLQLGLLFDCPELGVVVIVVSAETSGPSSSSMAVPSNIFIFNFGLSRSWPDAYGDADVEMAMKDAEVSDRGCLLEEGRSISVELQG